MTYNEECDEIAGKFAAMFSRCTSNPDGPSHCFCFETSKCVYCGAHFPYGEKAAASATSASDT